MDINITTPGNTENVHQTAINPTIKLDRRLIFSSNEEHNIWEMFSSNLLSFKHYPSGNDIEEEVKSVHEIIRIFENWKSQISTKKMSLFDFCKAIEKLSFHTETQDYRLRAIHKYKLLKRGMNSNMSSKQPDQINSKGDIHSDMLDQMSALKSAGDKQSLESDSGIREMLNARRELALKKRRLLLINMA